MTGHGREENGSQLGLQLGHLCDPPKTIRQKQWWSPPRSIKLPHVIFMVRLRALNPTERRHKFNQNAITRSLFQ
jgi:hypothetical protein